MASIVKNNQLNNRASSKSVFLEGIKTKRVNVYWHLVDRLSYKSKLIANIYEKTIGASYRDEIGKFKLKDSKNILHIGCGSYPITAMCLLEIKDAKIVTIDIYKKSLELAKKLIKRKNLEGKINVSYGDGKKFPLDSFDTIIVSGCSVPKIQVWSHILNNAKPNTRIIIRITNFDPDTIMELTDSKGKVKFIDELYCKPYPTCYWDSYLFVKK